MVPKPHDLTWVVWRKESREVGGKPTKVPYYADYALRGEDRRANAAKLTNHAPFRDAYLACEDTPGSWGIGFVIAKADPYTGIDLDDCRDPATGETEPWAQEIIDRANSYTEISPSGTGVKIWVRAKADVENCGIRDGRLEIYQSKFFTVTGDRLSGAPRAINPAQELVNDLVGGIKAKREAKRPAPARATSNASAGEPVATCATVLADDLEISERIRRHPKYDQLWVGDTSAYGNDHSKADLALCNRIAYFTGPDPDRIDRIFRRTGLFRAKWNRRDYARWTISKSLNDRVARDQFFQWPNPSKSGNVLTEEDNLGLPSKSECPTLGKEAEHIPESRTSVGEWLVENIIRRPTIDRQFSACRRIKHKLCHVDDPERRRIVGYSCRKRICPQCAPIWESDRVQWYTQIVAQFPEIHMLVTASESEGERVSRQVRRSEALYVSIPMPQDRRLWVVSQPIQQRGHGTVSEQISPEQMVEKVAGAIRDIPRRKHIGSNAEFVFAKREMADKAGEWFRDDDPTPLSKAAWPKICEVLDQYGINYEFGDYAWAERCWIEYRLPKDWRAADEGRMFEAMIPGWFANQKVYLRFERSSREFRLIVPPLPDMATGSISRPGGSW